MLRIVFRVAGSNIALILRKMTGCKISSCMKCLISPFSSIRTFGKGEITFGSKVEIRPNTEITARNGKIKIGNGCFINRNCMVVSHELVIIEDNVTIGSGTVIYDHDHDGKGGFITAPVVIKSGSWIGANVIILKGITIGKNVVVAAGSIVTKDIPDHTRLIQKRQNTITSIKKEDLGE